MRAAILLPAPFGRLDALRRLLAVADNLDRGGWDAVLAQHVFGAMGAAVAEGEIVLGGPALIAVAFNDELEVGKIIERRADHFGVLTESGQGGFG